MSFLAYDMSSKVSGYSGLGGSAHLVGFLGLSSFLRCAALLPLFPFLGSSLGRGHNFPYWILIFDLVLGSNL